MEQSDNNLNGQKIQDEKKFEQKLIKNYEKLGKVRITFRTQVAIQNSNKIQLFFQGYQKLWQLKLKMSDYTKQNIFFYINQSFMPSLDSRLGDLGQCYGRYDQSNKWYDLSLIVNSNEGRYG